jgi:hypothetical protein
MSNTQWDSEIAALKSEQNKIGKKIQLLEELKSLEIQHGGSHEERESSPKRRTPGRRRRSVGVATETGKSMKLPALLENIGSQQNRSMKHDEITALVDAAGYKSNSSDLSNMVYQALQKLVKKGSFVKNTETREYQFVGQVS